MDDGSSTYMLVMMLAMVVMSAFFSASETAYSSLNQIRLKSRAESGDAQARKVLALSKRYDSLLSTILIGNNIVNIALSSMGTVLFTRILGGSYGPTVSTVVITIALLLFGGEAQSVIQAAMGSVLRAVDDLVFHHHRDSRFL